METWGIRASTAKTTPHPEQHQQENRGKHDPTLNQIVHLSGCELVQLLDLSSPLKGRVRKRIRGHLGGELKAGKHYANGKHRSEEFHRSLSTASTIPAATG